MEKQNRINWKRGLVITPDILIASDNFHVSEKNLLASFLASRLYGVLPENNFIMEKRIANNLLMIKIMECKTITKEGFIINIEKEDHFQKEMPINDAPGNECYVVLSLNQKNKTSEDEEELYMLSDYCITLKNTSEPIKYGMPVLKIYKNNEDWEIDNHYIPPSIALNAVDSLRQKFIEIKNLIHKIIEKYPKNDPNFFQISLLQLELNSFNSEKSPEEWILLMKKMCWICYIHLKNENKMEENYTLKSFLNEQFNPNEIEKMMRLGYDCFVDVDTIFDIKPVEVENIFEIKV